MTSATRGKYIVRISYREPHRGDRILPAVKNVYTTYGLLVVIRSDDSELGIPLDLVEEYTSEERTS